MVSLITPNSCDKAAHLPNWLCMIGSSVSTQGAPIGNPLGAVCISHSSCPEHCHSDQNEFVGCIVFFYMSFSGASDRNMFCHSANSTIE